MRLRLHAPVARPAAGEVVELAGRAVPVAGPLGLLPVVDRDAAGVAGARPGDFLVHVHGVRPRLVAPRAHHTRGEAVVAALVAVPGGGGGGEGGGHRARADRGGGAGRTRWEGGGNWACFVSRIEGVILLRA